MTHHLVTHPNHQRSAVWQAVLERESYNQAVRAMPGPLRTRWAQRSEADPRQRTTLDITLRGGDDLTYMVTARGARGLFSGVTDLHTVLREIHTGERWYWADDD